MKRKIEVKIEVEKEAEKKKPEPLAMASMRTETSTFKLQSTIFVAAATGLHLNPCSSRAKCLLWPD